MAIEARDERFIEFAVASGQLDVALVPSLYELRKAATDQDAIEAFAVKLGYLTEEKVQKIVDYARTGATQSEPTTPGVRGAGSPAVKDDSQKAPPGKLLGQRFGPYEVLGEIARGGMGAVYRARLDGTDQVVALKVLLDEKNPPEATVRRFDREIRAGKEIDHQYVVKVFDAGAVDGRLYFTMELVLGRSFDKVMPELELRTNVEIFEKICRAVHQAHVRGYIHRDLKPQNVLVTKDLVPKVADFGLAKSLDRESRLTKTGAILGTVAYMSPEQAEGGGAHKLDARTDVYSLGAVLYQILTGSVPFKSATSFGTIGMILTQEPEPPTKVEPKCPPGLSAIALKTLEKEREKRFQSAAELADEVARWLAGTSVETQAPTLGARLGKWIRRRRLPLAACLLTIAVAFATLKALAWKHERDRKALVAETDARARALLAELAKPGSTAAFADRLDALDAAMKPLPELAATGLAIHGAALAARSLEDKEEPEKASAALEAAVAAVPARWDVRRAYVNALDRLGDPERAAQCLAEAPAKDAEVEERLGLELLEAGDPAGARTAFEAAGSKVLLARTLALMGDERALAAARALPTSDEAQLVQQEALLASDPGRAIDGLRLVERVRKTADVELRVAQALLRCERAFEARRAFERARAAGANPAKCLLGRAEAELLLGTPGIARSTLDEAAKLGSRFLRARALARKARIAQLEGSVPLEGGADDAPRLLRASIAFDALAVRFKKDEDRKLSDVLLGLAERAAPSSGPVLAERGQRLALAGSKTEAAKRLERAVAAVPGDARSLLLLASLAEGESAEKWADRVLALEPENARALSLRGRARLALRRAAEARADLERATRIDHRDADAWAGLAEAVEKLGLDSKRERDEERLRRDPLPVAIQALQNKEFARALDLAPGEPRVVKRVIDAVFEGATSIEEPYPLYARMIAIEPSLFLNGVFDRTALGQINPELADSYDREGAGSEALFTAFILRVAAIVRERGTNKELLGRARLDVERCLAADPTALMAVAGRGFVRAIERDTELAREDLDRTGDYAPELGVYLFARILVRDQTGAPTAEEVAQLDRVADHDALARWAIDITKKEGH